MNPSTFCYNIVASLAMAVGLDSAACENGNACTKKRVDNKNIRHIILNAFVSTYTGNFTVPLQFLRIGDQSVPGLACHLFSYFCSLPFHLWELAYTSIAQQLNIKDNIKALPLQLHMLFLVSEKLEKLSNVILILICWMWLLWCLSVSA